MGTLATYLPFTVTAMSELVPSGSVTVSVAAPGLIPLLRDRTLCPRLAFRNGLRVLGSLLLTVVASGSPTVMSMNWPTNMVTASCPGAHATELPGGQRFYRRWALRRGLLNCRFFDPRAPRLQALRPRAPRRALRRQMSDPGTPSTRVPPLKCHAIAFFMCAMIPTICVRPVNARIQHRFTLSRHGGFQRDETESLDSSHSHCLTH